MTAANDTTIRTERLLLRRLRPTDAEPLFKLFANWEVIRWLSTPPWPYTIDDARAFIAAQMDLDAGRGNYFAITLADALIGAVDARSNRPAGAPARSPVLGYWLGQPYWSRGYTTEAVRAFIRHLFAYPGPDTIYSGAFAGNAASLRVQEKLGFERTGEDMLYCRPCGTKRLHVNTELPRSRFRARPS
jgi:RimJ/RimL family protein N-acetyltransferase